MLLAIALGIPLAPILGLWAATWNFIPQIGGFVGALPLVALGFGHGPWTGLIALGVALAGGILEASVQIKGTPLDLSDFHIAWFIVAAVAAFSALSFLRLPPDAGANVSGHRGHELPKAEAVA